jgi:uncharacterized coiled-coil DUF342 family protein
MKTFRLSLLIILLSVAPALSVSAIQSVQDSDNHKDRRLNLLEKLENGSAITRDEISSSFSGNRVAEDDLFLPDEHLSGIFNNLKDGMNNAARELEYIRVSEEFQKAMEQFRKEREAFRRELEKLVDEIRKSAGELSGKEILHI